ncbi:MAG: hypothetical protein Q4E02_00120 [Lagierella massiliensis]|nr:hypothetical protein [Lagierella massiliensis]
MKSKEKIIISLLVISLVFNVIFAKKYYDLKEIASNSKIEKLIVDFDKKQPKDDKTIKDYLQLLSEGESLEILKNNEDVTEKYKNELLSFYNEEDFEGAKNFILEEELSIGYYQESDLELQGNN